MANPSLYDLARVFLKLGTTAFGGPAAHIAMMRTEVVEKRKWLSENEFLNLIGTTNLIPGPNSTELAILTGLKLAGYRGLFVAGLSFILPAFFIVLGLSVLYEKFGGLPDVSGMLTGMRPVIFVIVLIAIGKFGSALRATVGTRMLLLVSLFLAYLGVHELLIIFGAGVLNLIWSVRKPYLSISLELFLFFFKVGSVLFGSGYVLIAYLQRGLVEDHRWIDQMKLLDAVTIGQVTPGPVFTTATFIGYIVDGYEGAFLSTLGIFLPSFIFVALISFVTERLKNSSAFSSFLDGVNAGSIGLMGFVLLELAQKSFISVTSFLTGIIAFLILLKFKKINSAVLILAGALVGFFF